MKNLNTFLKPVYAIAIFSLILSCENISNPDPIDVVDEEKTAIIEGNVYANLDLTNDTTGVITQDFEKAPANTTIKLVLDSREFVNNPQPGIIYQELSYTSNIDGNGAYRFDIPALNRPINAEIYVDQFRTNQRQGDSTQVLRTFTPNASPVVVSITEGLTTFQDIFLVAN